MLFSSMRRWALAVVALVLIGAGVAGCGAPYSAPGSGTPAPTSPAGGGGY